MKNYLLVGGHENDRLRFSLNLIKPYFCPSSHRPCNTCHHCGRVDKFVHPNIFSISANHKEKSGQRKEITIDQAKTLVSEAQKTNPFNGPAFFLIFDAHLLNQNAANALLKTIEECPANKCFLFLAPSTKSVLPTISSRLVTKFISPEKIAFVPEEPHCKFILQFSYLNLNERISKAINWSKDREESRDFLLLIMETTHQLIRNYFTKNQVSISPRLGTKIIDALNHSLLQLAKNINVKLVIEELFFNHWPYLEPKSKIQVPTTTWK